MVIDYFLFNMNIHGYEWQFKHIFRGQPWRHLLATGWSTFVTSKRLVAGDAFVFLRGENGELRVGVRRLARQQSPIPSSVISSQSMHLGVLATASHADTKVASGLALSILEELELFYMILWGISGDRDKIVHQKHFRKPGEIMDWVTGLLEEFKMFADHQAHGGAVAKTEVSCSNQLVQGGGFRMNTDAAVKTVVVNGAKANRFFLSNEFKLVISSWPSSSVQLMGNDSIMQKQGEQHRCLRRLISPTLSHSAGLAALVPKVVKEKTKLTIQLLLLLP